MLYDWQIAQAPRRNYAWDDTEHWSLAVSTEPTEEPVTVAEARAHSRIVIYDDDLWVFSAIKAARILAETYTKRCFVTTGLTLKLDDFPPWEMYIPRPNLLAITSIKYLDANGTLTTLSSVNYTVDVLSKPGRVTPIYNAIWPSGQKHTNAVEVVYTAGYGAASAVPQAVKLAVLMTVATWYENRENMGDSMTELPGTAKALLSTECWGFLP